MKEIMIKTIKEDIMYIFQELENMRKTEKDKDLLIYIKDFRPYRSMVDTLLKTYDNFYRMIISNNLSRENARFIDNFLNSLIVESTELHKLMETCKGEYNQYRCLSDAYIKLTDKICRIERDRPKGIEVKRIIPWDCTEKNIELGLLKYQQDVVEFKGDNLICDWARNAGKTFTIAKTIELNRPKNVLYIDNLGSNYESLNILCGKFTDINNLNKNAGRESRIEMKIKTATRLEIQISNYQEEYSSDVNVYTLNSLKNGEVNRDKIVFDYAFFAEMLPYNLGDIKTKQSISFISYNDKDEWLERFYPNCEISRVDYRPLMTVGLLNQKMIDTCKNKNYDKFLNEFAILDNSLKPMYVDCIRIEGKETIKVLIYIEDKLIILDSKSMKDYAKIIYKIAIAKKSEIYIDVQGFGMSIYDYLMEFKDLKVNKLDTSKNY